MMMRSLTSSNTTTSLFFYSIVTISILSCLKNIEAFNFGHGGIPSSSSTSSRFAFRLHVATDTEDTKDDTSTETCWWKDYQLKDAALAEETRCDFPILGVTIGNNNNKTLIYFDNAATSHKPLKVTDALTSYYNTANSNVHRGAHSLSQQATKLYEEARDTVAKFVNAYSRNEVVFTSGATEALNLVAYSWGRANLKEGDEVIITAMEHHSNIVPWQIVAQETGAVLKILSVNDDGIDIEEYASLLSSKTKLVSVAHVSNVLGCVNPVADIVRMAKDESIGAKVLLDACQSTPHMKVDVQELGADWIAASGHKMCGPTGIGFLWGKLDVLREMQPFMGGGEMIQDVYLTHSTYADVPARFEAGTPQIAQAIGMGAALEYLMDIGMERISAYEHELAEYLHRRMSEVEGVRIFGPAPEKRGALVSFVTDGVHPSDLSTFLDMEGVAVRAGHHCCQPLHRELGVSHSARASLYFYNTKEEVDVFIEKLEETLAFFRNLESGGGFDADGSIDADGDVDGFEGFF